MSELQLALIAAGALAVVLVWLVNLWQERRQRKLAEEIFKGHQDDVLVRTARKNIADPMVPRREPGLADAHERAMPADDHRDAAPVDAADDGDELAAIGVPRAANPAGGDAPTPEADNRSAASAEDDLLPWVDSQADCVVSFALPAPVQATGLCAIAGRLDGDISKPVIWLARAGAGFPWTPVDATNSGSYAHWVLALQLVDRRGAVADAELGRFFDAVERLSAQLGVPITPPGRSQTLLRAQALDRFCADVDVQFTLSVVSQGAPFAGTKLRGVCEAAGLRLHAGRYHYRNSADETEFTVANLGPEVFDPTAMSSLATHGVSLSIDVPRVSDGSGAFNRMILVARQLTQGLGGVLVDAHRNPLSEQMILSIRNKIGELHAALNKAGIVPGSARAQRLFS